MRIELSKKQCSDCGIDPVKCPRAELKKEIEAEANDLHAARGLALLAGMAPTQIKNKSFSVQCLNDPGVPNRPESAMLTVSG